jgi:hypothetical protein
MARKKDKKVKGIKVDFTGVTSRTLVPEGDYVAKPIAAEKTKAQSSGKPTIAWEFEICKGKMSGQKLFYNTSLQPQALFNLRGLLDAMGVDVPDGSMTLDLAAILDEAPEVGVSVFHDTYDGSKRSKMDDVFPADSVEDGDDDGDDDSDDDSDDDDDDSGNEIDAEAVEEMDAEELAELVEENGLEVDLDSIKSLKKKRKAVIEAIASGDDDDGDDDDDDDDDDGDDDSDDEETEYSKSDIEDMDEEELDELAEAEEIELKKKDKKKVKDYRKNLIKALKKKGVTIS